MEQREIAILLSGVKKMYKLGQIGGGTLTADLQSWWARVRGKEDPNTKIGTDQRLVGKTFMALNGIDLTVYKGEALGIIGANGAGKSTLLKLLCRVTAPSEGEIDIYGRIASMLEVGTGFNGEMTGRENVYMNGAILGMTKAEIDAKMEDIIEFSEVREFIDTPVKRYSSGMYVKLAFSVAAHLDSEIMIMDEVLAVGDMAFQRKCLDKMRDTARKEGRTVLYVSHNMNTIRQLCDRCIVLDQGRVVFAGDVDKAIGAYLGTNRKMQTINDCSQLKREKICDGKIHMERIEMLDIKEPILYDINPLRLRITFNAEDNYPHTMFRMMIFSGLHSIVGMAAIHNPINVVKGTNEVAMELDLSLLAPGEYTGRLAFYEVNHYGGEIIRDVVDPGIRFRKENIKTVTDTITTWKHHVWGYIYFPEVAIIYENH